jgi:hypothetical protein
MSRRALKVPYSKYEYTSLSRVYLTKKDTFNAANVMEAILDSTRAHFCSGVNVSQMRSI